MRLSILVLSVPSRLGVAPVLLGELCRQAQDQPVEVLCLFDNKTRSVGAKRNALLDIAVGDYVVFADDDDEVSEDYVSGILGATASDPDVVVFDQLLTVNGTGPKRCTYGLQYHTVNTPERYQGKPAHTHAWRRALAVYERFPEINFAEDSTWARRLAAKAQTESRIDRVLYHYRFDALSTETR